MEQILVLTDTLAGAVDAALALTEAGVPTSLLLSPRADRPGTAAVVVDLDTARLAPSAAGLLAADAVPRLHRPGTALCRYIGPEPTAATAVAVAAIHKGMGRLGPPLLLVASASPEQGGPARTAAWRSALQDAGLRLDRLEAEITADGPEAVHHRLCAAAAQADVVVCEVADDEALATLAKGAALCGGMIWLGGRWLMSRLPPVLGLAGPSTVAPALPTPADPVLTVGEAGGAHVDPGGRRISVPARVLRLGPGSAEWGHAEQALREALSDGIDVTLGVAPAPHADADAGDGHALAVALGRLVREQLQRAGALVLSGGDTARAVLLAGAMGSVRVLGRTGAGGAVCLSEGRRALPVILVPDGAAVPDGLACGRDRLRTAAVPPVPEAGRGAASG